jgi:hypothetical protein
MSLFDNDLSRSKREKLSYIKKVKDFISIKSDLEVEMIKSFQRGDYPSSIRIVYETISEVVNLYKEGKLLKMLDLMNGDYVEPEHKKVKKKELHYTDQFMDFIYLSDALIYAFNFSFQQLTPDDKNTLSEWIDYIFNELEVKDSDDLKTIIDKIRSTYNELPDKYKTGFELDVKDLEKRYKKLISEEISEMEQQLVSEEPGQYEEQQYVEQEQYYPTEPENYIEEDEKTDESGLPPNLKPPK